MKAEQLSIFLENRSGRLAEVTRTLQRENINIRALSLADTSDFGILRIIVDDHERAKTALKDVGFTIGRTHVVAVEVPDKPGGLNHILHLVSGNAINVEYMYAYVQKGIVNATLIFRFNKVDEAIALLLKNNITVIPAERLYRS